MQTVYKKPSQSRLGAVIWKIRNSGPRQWLAILTGFWTGRGMHLSHTCWWCGGPCRSGGLADRMYYDRSSCPNRLCRNWIPF